MRIVTAIAPYTLLLVAMLAERSVAGPAPPLAAPATPTAGGQIESGVVVQVRLGTREQGFGNGAGGASTTALVPRRRTPGAALQAGFAER